MQAAGRFLVKIVKFVYSGTVNQHPDAYHSWHSRIHVGEGEIALQLGEGNTSWGIFEKKFIVPVMLSNGTFAYAICAHEAGWERWTLEI